MITDFLLEHRWLAPAAFVVGSGLSILIEVVQAAVTAIGRSCDSTDWLNNSVGAAVGAGLGALALVLARSSGRLEVSSGRAPGE